LKLGKRGELRGSMSVELNKWQKRDIYLVSKRWKNNGQMSGIKISPNRVFFFLILENRKSKELRLCPLN
jgi:hypothetical protein